MFIALMMNPIIKNSHLLIWIGFEWKSHVMICLRPYPSSYFYHLFGSRSDSKDCHKKNYIPRPYWFFFLPPLLCQHIIYIFEGRIFNDRSRPEGTSAEELFGVMAASFKKPWEEARIIHSIFFIILPKKKTACPCWCSHTLKSSAGEHEVAQL